MSDQSTSHNNISREAPSRDLVRMSSGKTSSGSRKVNVKSSSDLATIKFWSKALPDPFASDYKTQVSEYSIISPPINPNVLSKLVIENSFLSQCIRAMVTNTIGFGYTIEFSGNYKDKTNQSSDEVLNELRDLEELFDQPNPFETYSQFCEKLHEDKATFENAYIETVRDNLGKVISFYHLPSPTMRITKIDPEPTEIVTELKRGGKIYKQKIKKHFRRYVQIKPDGFTKVWFKEFGDPRKIDPKTGKVNNALTFEEAATEVIHIADYNPNSVYGLPRWYSQMTSILGSRQAELTNLDFFENNAIPAMAILVAGGLLTEDTVNLLEQGFDDIKGRSATNKVAIIEASPNLDAASASGATPTPSIKMEPLYAARQQDATFLNYTQDCMQKIMSSFRLPPVYVAGGKDYTYACHDDKTEFLSDKGWKLLKDYKEGDKIAVYDAEKTHIKYEYPKAYYSIPFQGNLVRFESQQVSMAVTDNHSMLYSKSYRGELVTDYAANVAKRNKNWFIQSANFVEDKKDLKTINIPFIKLRGGPNAKKPPVKPVPADLFLEWLGYQVSEGSVTSSKKHSFACMLSQKKEPNLTKMTKCLQKMEEHGFNVYWNTDKNNKKGCTYHGINYKGLYQWVVDNVGTYSHNKRLPELVWSLSQRQKEILLDALMLGDGHVIPHKHTINYHYSSNSDVLINQVLRLVTDLGYVGKIRTGTRCKYVMFWKPNKCVSADKRKGQIFEEAYSGNVYCFETSTGFFLTRRNQNQVISGNSSKVSVEVAETQVFIPARKMFDDIINKTIVSSWKPKYWTYRTNNATIATTEDLINAVEAFTEAGGITPNIARAMMNKALNIDVPEIDEVYGNLPSSFLNSILKGSGGEDKTNLIINSMKTLLAKSEDDLTPIKVITPGNADAINDPNKEKKPAVGT